MSPTILEQVSKPKLGGYDFFRSIGSPKHIVAPMVDQSEHAWRILCRRYNSHLCFTPMFHAKLFSDPDTGHKYRKEQWSTDKEDRPLIVQFCANDPELLLRAAKLVENDCDAVDLNLGCPQHIARRGKYGSYLQDEWDLIKDMVSTLHRELAVPVTVKIRVFPTVERTLEYAKMIEAAGAQMLTVHGRLREQKGHNTGLADWDKIKAVKEAVKIPVIANGNILYHEDVQRCLDYTGCDGVMSAEGNLYNPAIFSPREMPPFIWEMAHEYLDICKTTYTRVGTMKAHLFKILQPSLPVHTDLRTALAKAGSIEELISIVDQFKERLEKEVQEKGEEEFNGTADERGIRKYGHWRCQPYFRPVLPADHGKAKGEQRKREKEEALKAQEDSIAEDHVDKKPRQEEAACC
ncbi:tRNA dihydrouridine synthase [Umbelopsis sp. WA50703]